MARLPLLSARTSGDFVMRLWCTMIDNIQKQCCTLHHDAGAEDASTAADHCVTALHRSESFAAEGGAVVAAY